MRIVKEQVSAEIEILEDVRIPGTQIILEKGDVIEVIEAKKKKKAEEEDDDMEDEEDEEEKEVEETKKKK